MDFTRLIDLDLIHKDQSTDSLLHTS